MIRLLRNLILSLILALITAAAFTCYTSPDPFYTAQEMVWFKRYAQFDPLIREIAEKRGLDPMLVKAVVWRETRFRADMVGNDGERGLMQVTEGAAEDWSKAENIEDFRPADLFDPRTNLEVGTWYLSRAVERWNDRDDPIPFALAEYNAGRSRVNQWIVDSTRGDDADAEDLRENVAFPTTRSYIETIEDRYRFYQERGRL